MPLPRLFRLFRRLQVMVGGRLRRLRAWAALLVAMRRRTRATELWIGDSHALSFNDKVSMSPFARGPEGQIVRRLGPRLMYSIAQKGFPPRVHRLVGVVRRWGVPGSIVPVFIAGEIDVRCHLADHDADFGFVADYVARCQELASGLRAERTVYAVPPPPSEACPSIEEFPVRGTIAERVKAFNSLREALADAVARTPGAELLDATEGLIRADGSIRPELTDDGCHTNLDGMRIVRARARELELGVRP